MPNTLSRNDDIKVWPLWLRCFHWLLVAAFLISYLTGDDYRQIHVWSGYLIIALLLLRIGLGLLSSGFASLRGWFCSPRQAVGYLGGLLRGDGRRYLGHNPAGACMSLALVLTLSVTLGTGLALHGVHGAGPLAVVMDAQNSAQPDASTKSSHEHDHEDEEEEDAAEEFWEELHELFVNISLALVILHILGVLASSWRHRENLPKSMLSGRKKRLPE